MINNMLDDQTLMNIMQGYWCKE